MVVISILSKVESESPYIIVDVYLYHRVDMSAYHILISVLHQKISLVADFETCTYYMVTLSKSYIAHGTERLTHLS